MSHFEETLERDIQRICRLVKEMARLAERGLRDCIQALVENNRQLAYAVILRDQYIDEKEKEIDRLCLEFIVRQQPVAGPLRFAYSTIKINLELERVGDYAESIARHILRLDSSSNKKSIPTARFVELADLSIPMLRDAIEAFVRQDSELAKTTIAVEDAVDALQSKLNAELFQLLHEEKLPLDMLDPLVTIGKRLERVSDQARNICMDVLYMCTGEDPRHPGAETFRILFVDGHNSCRSQMAEAIAQSLDQPKFIFQSAGLEPRPIDANTLQFMQKKGLDLSRAAPKTIYQVPYLDHYQVIVALAKEAQRAFPMRPRKMVYVDWSVGDPSSVHGSPEEIDDAYETTFKFISSHVRALVEAVLGNKLE
ncbi:MAG: phosphate signaling complex protein PhoU [Vicinamibacteria bacterium]|nr:phosphate signaling complex protein PhoU [Vicinamibacteria bacterium]